LSVWVSLKTGRFAAPAGRQGDVVQYREPPSETGRLNMYGTLVNMALAADWMVLK